MAIRKHTEFGGGEGSPQRYPDKASKPLTPAENARVLRQVGIQTNGEDILEERLGESTRRKERRKRLERDTNQYSAEADGGEQVQK